MVAKCHLILLLRLVQVTVIHLHHGFFGVDLTVMILLVDLDVLLQLLSLRQTQHFTPVGQDLHSVEVSHLLLLLHVLLQLLTLHANSLHLVVNVGEDGVSVLDLDGEALVFVVGVAAPFDVLTEDSHN